MRSPFSSPPDNERPYLIRVDFTDQAAWDIVRSMLVDPQTPDDIGLEFQIVDDVQFDGLTPAGLLELEPHRAAGYFLADHETVSHPDHPVLTVDVSAAPARWFRLPPATVQAFAVNMSLANMNFEDFADNVEDDGIFRGFDVSPGVNGSSSPPASLSVAQLPPGARSAPARRSAEWPMDDLVREALADDPESFVGQLLRQRFWNPASWQRLEAAMRECCRRYDGYADLPRAVTGAFHSVLVRVPNLVAVPGFIAVDQDYLEARLERIRLLGSWLFNGWSMNRPDGPVTGEYDPDDSHG